MHRLPPYHCELNPIELIWSNVKGFIARRNTQFKLANLQSLLLEAIDSISPHLWQQCIKHIIEKVEDNMWKIDGIMDAVAEPFIINFNNSDSDSEFEEDPDDPDW